MVKLLPERVPWRKGPACLRCIGSGYLVRREVVPLDAEQAARVRPGLRFLGRCVWTYMACSACGGFGRRLGAIVLLLAAAAGCRSPARAEWHVELEGPQAIAAAGPGQPGLATRLQVELPRPPAWWSIHDQVAVDELLAWAYPRVLDVRR